MKKEYPAPLEQSISVAVKALHSDDVLTQNRGVEQLIQLGAAAVPELLKEMSQPETNHAQLMYALSQIANTQATEAYKNGLTHHNEQVRAYAAQGLVRINHADALSACLQTINDAASEAHLDITPAVTALSDMGLIAVPALLDLLTNDDEMTRLHAQRALELFINKRHGFIPGQGFPSERDEQAARNEWQGNGNYDYNADEQSRAASIAKWQQWLDSVEK